MQFIADADEAKEIDGISIHEIGIPSFVLMERASLSMADCVLAFAKQGAERILVVCGMGNNGGDGAACGRILAEKGFSVEILLLGQEEKASEEMKRQLLIARNLSVPVITTALPSEYTIIIDAMFGIGLSREITGEYAEWVRKINTSGAVIVSADIPSGIDASTGKVLGNAIKADYTVTFGIKKRGLVLFPGMQYAGQVIVADIGFPAAAVEKVNPKAVSYGREDIFTLFPKRIPRSNKGSYGKTLVIAGSAQMSGAAFFAAAAAYRMGSGLVKILTHENNRTMLQANLPEALLSTYDGTEFLGTAEAADREVSVFGKRLAEELQWATTVIIGPGLGQSDIADFLLKQALTIRDIPVLVDADGLNLLAKVLEEGAYPAKNNAENSSELFHLPGNFLLTPHLKEMSRLVKKDVEQIKDNIPAACQYISGAVLALKDARTVVSDGERLYINQSGNNALAKGGSGDILSGMIGGLLALGMPSFEAASLGVYLHGLTAEEYVKKRGFSSMLASDILEELKNLLP
ncbi:NAD(P)H-hydrate dehydratase [bacterium D16-51]|nr:NAD(P)H-hydrate dehydratase [bacterium D16-59]RKI61861.1 NAD(P)H-hydrate dehydratase [bacterium D16-51]